MSPSNDRQRGAQCLNLQPNTLLRSTAGARKACERRVFRARGFRARATTAGTRNPEWSAPSQFSNTEAPPAACAGDCDAPVLAVFFVLRMIALDPPGKISGKVHDYDRSTFVNAQKLDQIITRRRCR